MLCGSGSWKLLSPLVALIEKSDNVEIFIYEEDPNLQILISDIIESLYVDISKKSLIKTQAKHFINRMKT